MQISPLNPPPSAPVASQNPGQHIIVPHVATQAGAKPVLANAVASPPKSERSPKKKSNEDRAKGGEATDAEAADKRGKAVNLTV
jgi:hypothetical protein